MNPRTALKFHAHPYVWNEDTHGHFKPTLIAYPPYSAPTIPLRWMRRDALSELQRQCPLDGVLEELEPTLRFTKGWWQDFRNQTVLLEKFWAHAEPEESLIFFYAKHVPLAEEVPGRRVLIGVGRVKRVHSLKEYDYEGHSDGRLRSMLWERMIEHSIRPSHTDGFLMPYQTALDLSRDGNEFNPAEVVALTPEDRFTEFSYGTEHLGADTAIEALNSMRTALLRSVELFGADIRKEDAWIEKEMSSLWKQRGPFPGIGSVLSAWGVPKGHFIAKGLEDLASNSVSPWSIWYSILEKPHKHLPRELANCIDATIAQAWQSMPSERQAFLELLSRIDLTPQQADLLVTPEQRMEAGLRNPDSDFLKNPYLIYEITRLTTTPVSVKAVDRGMLSSQSIDGKFQVPKPTRIDTPVDARRLRALTIKELEAAAQNGNTLLPRANVITELRNSDQSKDGTQTLVTADALNVAERQSFDREIRMVSLADGTPAYQLVRLGEAGDRIRRLIERRISGRRHDIRVDWRQEVDRAFDPFDADPTQAEDETRARIEKSAALEEIANSRFSVLLGSAGTGKTSLLSILCAHPEIRRQGVLLLAPTGKARVRMAQLINPNGAKEIQAFTLAQFLIRTDRYSSETQRYLTTGKPGSKEGGTVIVDECSMLTEEMLASLFESLIGFKRLIMVGDPGQLPPIGAGRPFVDIIARLKPADFEPGSPRVAPSYAELTVPRRQGTRDRDDLALASWFGGEHNPSQDSVFEILAGHRSSANLKIYTWDAADELIDKLPKILSEQLGFDPQADETLEFSRTLGGTVSEGYAYFNRKRSGAAAEGWQILAPAKHTPWGVDPLNRFIHQTYKGKQIHAAKTQQYRFLKPQGGQLIVYGDKVINTRNRAVPKRLRWPDEDGYLANGEVGIVVGEMRTKRYPHTPKHMQVEYSTQPGYVVKYFQDDFNEESDPDLELAYALTVHRSQGSEFKTVILVLPKSNRILSRELMYTALTRQTERIVLLLQGSLNDLQHLSAEQYSETAARLTNLFAPPKPVEVGNQFLEYRLIHRTVRGEAVRSKSEVIIANLLYAQDVPYRYEEPLEIDSTVKYPDFTIDDDDTGETYYWEHLGMLDDAAYRRAWKEKLLWYESHGIVPLDKGGGSRGSLILTEDSKDGGFDSRAAGRLITEVFAI